MRTTRIFSCLLVVFGLTEVQGCDVCMRKLLCPGCDGSVGNGERMASDLRSMSPQGKRTPLIVSHS